MRRRLHSRKEHLVNRLQTDKRLANLFNQMARHDNADNVLFRMVFDENLLDLEDVERLLIVAQRLETYVRCQSAWRGN